MSLVICSLDLMGISAITGAARSRNIPAVTIRTAADLPLKAPDTAALAVIDLDSMPGNLHELVSAIRAACPSARIIAYGPHVKEALLEQAARSGCDKVMTRGQFMRSLQGPLFEQDGSEQDGRENS